jgi:cytoskeleton protein RodZ
MLRAARLAHDLTLDQLSTELRIEAKQLNALEENRFERIGVPVFVKGYLKQYGQRLGVDVADLLALYYKQTTLADVQIQPSRSIKLRDERQITSWVLAGIVLLLVVVGLAVWWWNGGTFAAGPFTLPAAPTTSSPAPAGPAPQASSLSIEQSVASSPAASLPSASLPSANAPAAVTDVPAVSSTSSALSVSVANVEPTDDPEEAEAAPVIAIPLEFTFDAESWAEVTDARGERLLFGLNAAGRRVTVRGEPPFAVVIGNANVVRLALDGEPYAIPTTGRQGDLARFSVDIAEE